MTEIIDLARYLTDKLGAVPDRRAKCPGCGMPRELFALARLSVGGWRCGHCIAAKQRVDAPAFQLTWNDVRGHRSVLLAACDWTQLGDVPEPVRLLWQPYRQALRDITEQECEPDQVSWPIQPSARNE